MTLSYGTTCVEGIKRSQGKIKIVNFLSHIFYPLFRVCFEYKENIFLNNHLGHIPFGMVRVFKVLPSIT